MGAQGLPLARIAAKPRFLPISLFKDFGTLLGHNKRIFDIFLSKDFLSSLPHFQSLVNWIFGRYRFAKTCTFVALTFSCSCFP